jgi:ABC-2 type transport system ATP-binding protein
MQETMIETVGLSKSFGKVFAVDAFDWKVKAGSIAGVVGPNGAGKSTLLKMLLGMTRPTSGTGFVLDHDISRESAVIRRHTGFVPEDKLVYDEMRVSSFTRFVASFFGEWDAAEAHRLLAGWSIPLNEKIKTLSKGMRAKLVLTAAICRKPRVLLLDEPTMDLDAASVNEVLALITSWVAEGDRTVVVATHRLEEAERICDSVSILRSGRQVLSGDVDDIKNDWKMLAAFGTAPVSDIRAWSGVRKVSTSGEVTRVVVDSNAEVVANMLDGHGARAVEIHDMNLREIFLAVTDEM